MWSIDSIARQCHCALLNERCLHAVATCLLKKLSLLLVLQTSGWWLTAVAGLQVMQGDIRSGNVLLSGDFSQAKICDVGLAHVMGSTSNSGKSVQATFAYAAPEMLFNYR